MTRAAPGELIVGLRGTPESPVRVRVDAGDGASLERAAETYRRRPDVAFAHPNWLGRGGFTPNDSPWPALWHHRNIGQTGGVPGADLESEAGWDRHRGSASVIVAVLDTGIDSDHPEFAGRIMPGWDFVNGDADPEDDHGHGTFVTGVLAANANNAFGTAGVDHACMILPVKVLNASNVGTTFDVIRGLDHARTSGAHVLNLSLVGFPQSAGLDQALQRAHDAGIILVACAGNGGLGNADVSWPGASPLTISVGASTGLDTRATFSGTGNALEFLAPGKDVPTVLFGSHANGTALLTGCSASTPIVAGIVSILRAVDPTLTTAGARALLQAGAEDQVGNPDEDVPGWDPFYGNGRVNLRATLDASLGVVASPAPAAGPGCTLEIRPNPIRGATALHVSLPVAGHLSLAIFDVAGRRVRTVHDGPWPAGRQARAWDGRDDRQEPLAPGVYFVRAEALGEVRVRKASVVR